MKRKIELMEESSKKRKFIEKIDIKKLPKEMICYIFEFLSLPFLLKEVSCVCKEFHYLISNHPPIWNTITFQYIPQFEDFLMLHKEKLFLVKKLNFIDGTKGKLSPHRNLHFQI